MSSAWTTNFFFLLLLVGASSSANAFQLPSTSSSAIIPSSTSRRRHLSSFIISNPTITTTKSIKEAHHNNPLLSNNNNLDTSSTTTTALYGKLWKRLHIEEDDPADGTSWYLINCVAGIELDLLNQCRYVCGPEQKNFPPDLVEKFVVPTERHLRSHGDKKKVVDVKVRYPGYVFCKIRLVEDVYETLQELELARSWMGTVNRKGHKKLPPAPLPLGPEEVAKFKGLEEEQELFEDMYGGDYTGRSDTGADLLDQYAGYDVGQMVKVLRGNFEGEDGTVRRLKGGQLMVRMFTYGQTYDEWFDPDAIRPLSDLEVMKGLSGPTQPINQDQFDVSIGKKDPSELEDGTMDGGGSGGAMRSGLLQSAGIAPGRNRREDRVARGETGNRDLFGRSADEIKKEEQNWLAYREEQRANSRGGRDSEFDMLPDLTETQKKKAMGPKKGQDTWGITERSSWNGGEYGFDANSEEEERERKRRTEMLYKDRPVRGGRGGRGRDGRDSFNQRRDNNFDDRRGGTDRNERERRPMRPSSRDNNWSTSSKAADEDGASKEDDFFDSLMSELSDDLSNNDASRDTGARARGARSHDSAGPNTRGVEKRSNNSGGEDDFFESLMSELGGALDNKPAAASSLSSSSFDKDRKLDDDDFFSSLEAELSQSLGNDESTEKEEDISDDFFSSLMDDVADELELDKPKDSSSTEMLDDDGDDFFSTLLDDLDVQLEHESPVQKDSTATKQSAPQHHDGNNSDLKSLTVPELKDLLRSKGLKVGGKKAELIERLQS